MIKLTSILFPALAFMSCNKGGKNGYPPTNEGGKAKIIVKTRSNGDTYSVYEIIQPDNPTKPTTIHIETNGTARVELPSSEIPVYDGAADIIGSLGSLTTIGAITAVAGLIMIAVSRKFPILFPIMSGVSVFIGGLFMALVPVLYNDYADLAVYGAVGYAVAVIAPFFKWRKEKKNSSLKSNS